MTKFSNILLSLSFLFLLFSCQKKEAKEVLTYDVLIIGGGASGTTAGIQSARMGVSTLIVEETLWLGGMLTSAGVSAIDGNYHLNSGLWQEFKEQLSTHYGGLNSLKTGWVSNVLFEPQVGAKLLGDMAQNEEKLDVWYQSQFLSISKEDFLWKVQIDKNGIPVTIKAQIVIDGTELGDIAKVVNIPYTIGMDSREATKEDIAPKKANDIVQDLTYVAILKDYGPNADKTISKPKNYDPTPFYCTCAGKCSEEESDGRKLWPCDQMMNYGKLPNGYYMINWPLFGNDYYVNAIEMDRKQREQAYEKAKEFTLNYIYYLQTELGFKHLGIANDVYPTEDNLPFIPYHRESRRIDGLVRFDINDLAKPYEQDEALYRTGIAVGDYPVDHHHYAYPDFKKLPNLHFYPVPSYSIPLGTLIPKDTSNFIVAEKSISVTNLVNGTTRLQPVCLLIGQAAGALAALSVKENHSPKNVSIRKVQQVLLDNNAYILPYSDISPESEAFKPLQRIGATGILRGEGKNIGWKNHTHIYPDSLLSAKALTLGLKDWLDNEKLSFEKELVSLSEIKMIIRLLSDKYGNKDLNNIEVVLDKLITENRIRLKEKKHLSRADFAILLNESIDPFTLREVDYRGFFKD